MISGELNILVVEDDAFQRRMLARMLRSLGLRWINETEHGGHALEEIQKRSKGYFDIVICDIDMPEMDGMEFLRHLGEQKHEIAAIIHSSLNSKLLDSVGRMASLYGINILGVVEKPMTLQPLNRFLSGFIPGTRAMDQATVPMFPIDEVLHGLRARQFEPFFQPKVEMASGRLIGAEALARWRHPEHGMIGPNQFLTVIEQNGKTHDLTLTMLEQSAAACFSLREAGHPLTVAVNLSLASFNDLALANTITQAVRNADCDPKYIMLEITETAVMGEIAHALENMARLCMNGFGLSIDDFGTGYSSLQQLSRIPFGELKIDKSFVKDLADNESSRIVVMSSIDMARKLRIKSVAEGVETKADWDMLRHYGCDIAQGYFIARPMDQASFAEYCANYSPERLIPR